MLGRLAQFFAIAALIASAVNAQCARSCSLQEMSRSVAHRTQDVVSRTGHSCCPIKRSPEPKDRKRQRPCSDPSPAFSDIGITTGLQNFEGPHSFAFAPDRSFDLVLPVRQTPSSPPIDSSAIRDSLTFSVLRV